MTKRLCLGLLTGLVVAAPLYAASSDPVSLRLDILERRVSKVSDLTLQLSALREENQQLRGAIELLQHEIDTLKRKQRDLYLDVDQRISSLQQAPAAPAAAPVAPAAGGSGPAPVPSKIEPIGRPTADVQPVSVTPAPAQAIDPAQEQADYKAAYSLLSPQQRRYKEAVKAFRAFLAKYPGSKLAANAQYWLAEASYVTGDNETALAEFQQVLDSYPGSIKIPDAQLKIGYIQHALGNPDKAREILNRVVRDYPETSVADFAQQRLQRITTESR